MLNRGVARGGLGVAAYLISPHGFFAEFTDGHLWGKTIEAVASVFNKTFTTPQQQPRQS